MGLGLPAENEIVQVLDFRPPFVGGCGKGAAERLGLDKSGDGFAFVCGVVAGVAHGNFFPFLMENAHPDHSMQGGGEYAKNFFEKFEKSA